ncbi:helix-turn-helix domain-containing protein [Oscillibacter sp.]
MGATQTTARRWMNGPCRPSFGNLPKIANALRVSTDYLCGITK